jgi:hypothetical protein
VATCAPSGQWQQMAGSGLDVANPRAVADAYDALSAVVTLDRERDGSAKHPTGLAATKPSNGSQRTTAALEETQAGGGLHVDSY